MLIFINCINIYYNIHIIQIKFALIYLMDKNVAEYRHLTFMHLADAFIQSDLQCIQAIHVLSL